MTCDTVTKPLHILINRSLAECTFPSLWEKPVVMPLFKKGSPDAPSNYRPISLISTVGKLMERVVYKHLYNFSALTILSINCSLDFCQAIPQYSSLLISIIKFVKVLILNSIHA